ncbi:hypothetical protein LDENG_00071720 [Lucifuga dentata]|nr:hypothetical protein LDENG_00071720 [Lucifuga dentata]
MAGLNVLSAPGEHTQSRSVLELRLHENYSVETFDSDVALLLLSSPLNFNDHIQPICIPDNVIHEQTLKFSHCFIAGWGSTYFTGTPVNSMQEAEVMLIDRRTCNQFSWHDGIITKNMVCAGQESGGVDTCQGDSGGPLQCYSKKEERFYLVGVTSFGEDCGLPYKPGVYAQTSRFASWLKTTQPISRSAAHSMNTRLTISLMSAAWMLLGINQCVTI